MLVLEGAAGPLKSTRLQNPRRPVVLRQPARHTTGKDVPQHLRGKWLIEIAEMHAI